MPLLAPLVLALALTGAPGQSTASEGTWPLGPDHQVVRGFDPPATPWAAGHRGVDLLGSPGEAVHAALAGTVTFAGELAGRGVVVVDHDGRRTTYEPVTAGVSVGTAVADGAVIGQLEAGLMSHCFPRTCLHWGLIRGRVYLDPLTLVGGGAIRLLPLAGLPATATARSVIASRAQPPARRLAAVHHHPLGVPLAPLLAVLRPGDGPGGTPRGAVRW